EEMQIDLAEPGRKAIGIVELDLLPAPIDDEVIGEAAAPVDAAGEEARLVHLLQRSERPRGARIEHGHATRLGEERAHHDALVRLVRAEIGERIRVVAADDGGSVVARGVYSAHGGLRSGA